MKKTVRQKKASPINHTNTAEMSSKKSGVAQGYGIEQPTVGTIANSQLVTQQQKKLDTLFGTAQREKKPEEDEKLMQPKWAIQREPNNETAANNNDSKSITGSFQAKISETDAEELTQQKAIQRKKGEEEEELLQGKFSNPEAQMKLDDEEEKLPGQAKAITQRVENKTGMPDNLKAGVEQLSGLDMSDVHVHYNSAKPASVQAHAYTQGTDIHVAPGQEKHVGHEAWHVAQQKQGRVQPTTTIAGMPVNDSISLEHEADVMGAKAIQYKSNMTESSQNLFNVKPQKELIQPMMKKLGVDKDKYKQMLRSTVYLYAEYNGKPFGDDGGIFHTTSGAHAEENLIKAIIAAKIKGGSLTVYLSTSPCSSTFGTRDDGELGCQERLEALKKDLGIDVNVIADHLYQPQAIGVMERESGFSTGMSSYGSAVTSPFDLTFSHLPKSYYDKDLIDNSDVAQLQKTSGDHKPIG